MAISPLALHESQETYAGSLGWEKVLDPQLRRDVKATTKVLLKEAAAAQAVQLTAPPPRFLERQTARETE
jgi:hypothetical protein